MGFAHTEMTEKILLQCSGKDVRLWRNETGVARSLKGERIIRFGLHGSADITGIAKCASGRGLRVEIEVKIGKHKMSIEQERFAAMIRNLGGFYLEARSPQQAFDKLKEFMQSN